ncbi:RES domain-containing protein [Reichenbachiella sp. MALMAid0571]|uniref:RES domain-containing protein n=1 Tax=Reichenbachiella sp. MALMAid0571 TaxID=3143939 RepID=UPI0032DF2195
MLVCKNCFSDEELELIGFIQSSGKKGDCEVCNSRGVSTLELEELLDFFQELLNNFQLSKNGTSLKSKIQENWNFFSSPQNASKILNKVAQNLNSEITSADDLVDYTEDIIQNGSYWDTLKESIKWERRYVQDIDFLTMELGWDEFFNTQYELDSTTKLFRARVHHESGMKPYISENMMCPEPKLASGGRANPSGIPFLYLSDNTETVLYEVRASYLDELSIGEFQLKKEFDKVKIVDFTEDTMLYQSGRINSTIKARLLRDKVSLELSKPMRRYDTDIEYIPTQFICEFIKTFTGANGIRFRSSLHPKGNNIVMFDQAIMECTKVILKKISKLNLGSTEIK